MCSLNVLNPPTSQRIGSSIGVIQPVDQNLNVHKTDELPTGMCHAAIVICSKNQTTKLARSNRITTLVALGRHFFQHRADTRKSRHPSQHIMRHNGKKAILNGIGLRQFFSCPAQTLVIDQSGGTPPMMLASPCLQDCISI